MKDANANFNKLVTLLSDCQFHDGDTLGERVGVSRTAIWKMTKKLIDYGVPVTSVKGKGYILQEPLILLDKSAITKSLSKTLSKQIDLTVLESTKSTNLYLRQLPSQTKASICIAEHQSAGIGRLSRVWSSPFGLNLYLSYRSYLQCDIADLSGLSLAISVAVLNTLIKFDLAPQIKWPNDIYCSGKKLAGSLIELIAESNGGCTAIIGVGINVNVLESTDKITQPWTSMRIETNQLYNRNKIAAELIEQLAATLDTFLEHGLPAFKEIYAQHDYLYRRKIIIQQHQSQLEGEAVGIDDFGRLLLQTATDTILPISVGDATLKR